MDDKSLGVVPGTNGKDKKLEVKGASLSESTKNLYFGTPWKDGFSGIGWWPLPVGDVDDESLNTNSNGRIQLNDWEKWKNDGKTGFIGKKRDSLVCWPLNGTNGVVTTDNESMATADIGLEGWDNPSGCNENLSKLLTDTSAASATDRKHHKILTRYDGKSPASVHWLPIGDVLDVGGGVWEFYGTEDTSTPGATIGSGGTTNQIHFASEADSNVKVTCSGSDNSVTIKIGVYYK